MIDNILYGHELESLKYKYTGHNIEKYELWANNVTRALLEPTVKDNVECYKVMVMYDIKQPRNRIYTKNW